jgi:hypothetical protein
MSDKKHIEEILAFIREHRSDEANFEKLYQKLDDELQNKQPDGNYIHNLKEIKEKQAEEFRQTKQNGGSAWPEFEKFVTEFERTLTDEIR